VLEKHDTSPPVAPTVGGVVFAFTSAVAVPVHLPFVTVTVYVPVALTVGVAVAPPDTMPGPLQLNPAPGKSVEAERVADVVVLVRLPPVALAATAAKFESTRAAAVPVQPLVGSTTLTMYVPVALTVGVAVLPPETIPGPDQ